MLVITPLPSWSTPLACTGTVVVTPALMTFQVLRGPYPCPTTSVAIVATPRSAFCDAARKRSVSVRVNPCPNTVTGHPPAGAGPAGRIATNGSRA